jgi:hypothetical protein
VHGGAVVFVTWQTEKWNLRSAGEQQVLLSWLLEQEAMESKRCGGSLVYTENCNLEKKNDLKGAENSDYYFYDRLEKAPVQGGLENSGFIDMWRQGWITEGAGGQRMKHT